MARRVAKAGAWLLATAALLLMVGWLSLHWLILPHIERWREPLERQASRWLGAPVRIGAISVQSGRWMPAIELRDVRVLDHEQRTALALPHVAAALSPRSLLVFEPRFEQLLIDGASLEVRRDATGRIRIAGLDFGSGAASGADDGAAADWFFSQHEFAIRGGTLRWVDEARQAPPLVLDNVELVARNGLGGHQLRLDATPPPEWGDRFGVQAQFSQPLFARNGDWRRWSGTVFASLPRADVRELRRHVQLPFELSEGDGALRGWIDVRDGQPSGAVVDLALRAVTLRLERDVETLDIEQLRGRISGERSDDGGAVHARGLAFVTGNGLAWPSSDLDVAWSQADGGPVRGGDVAASRLDLGVMAQIAQSVPLGRAVRELLADLRPRGVVSHLAARWQGPLDSPEHYAVKGSLAGLALAAKPAERADAIGRPGLSGASLDLDASEAGGQARIAIVDGSIELPGVFAEPVLALQRFAATLNWTATRSAVAAPAIVVKVAAAQFANADLHGALSATWQSGAGTSTGGRFPGRLDLDGHLTDVDAARSRRYLPLGLPDDVRSYLTRAVRSGVIASADIKVHGDLADFPFIGAQHARGGDFRFAARLRDLVFAYLPDDAVPPLWPPLSHGAGEIVIDHGTLELNDASAQIGGVDWRNVHGRIGEGGPAAKLVMEGQTRAALADLLHFVNTTPVGRWTGNALAGTAASGPAELRLALTVPLADSSAPAGARGTLTLTGNDVRMTADTPLLAGARGRIDFTHKGFAVSAASARVLGGDLTFDGGSSNGLAGGETQRFLGQGTLTAEALRRAPELGTLARLAGALSGQASYRGSLAFIGGRPQIEFASNLVGLAIDLPAPLGKAAPTALPLRLRSGAVETAVASAASASAAASAAAPVGDALALELGQVVVAHFERGPSASAVAPMRGIVRIGAVADHGAVISATPAPGAMPAPLDALALPVPADGVHAAVELDQLDVDAWQAAFERLESSAGEGAAAASGTAPPLVFDSTGGTGYVPDHVALHVRLLEAGGRHFTNVTAGLTQTGGLWRANARAEELEGYAEYRPAGRAGSSAAGRVYARLARLKLPRDDAERVEKLLEEPPASIPGLDVVVDAFELRGKRLGRLEIQAVNRAGSAARDWELSTLNLTVPEAHLQASGTWSVPPGGRRGAPRQAAMTFDLAVADSGALLERLGLARIVRGGKGSLSGHLSWPGSPLSPDYARMTGDVKVAFESGQFLKAGPGVARLLGVLSLQSLPRRLLLDFRDVFEEGFAFDDVAGDVAIGGGLARTNNLRMRGASAAVLMEGSADLEHETEDLRVVVVPEINAGTASLAYAVINPAIGLGTFLAQYFLKKPLTAAITREFQVTGPWEDPKVERVVRSVAASAVSGVEAVPAESPKSRQ